MSGRWHPGGSPISIPSGSRHLTLSPRPQSQRAAVFVVLFALLMLLIIYSSSNGTEVFPYGALRGRARRPPDLRRWGVSSGYLPVSGNKVWRGWDITVGTHCPVVTPSSTVPVGGTPKNSPSDPVGRPQSLSAHCHQCVIVTSSSHLLGTRLGAEIDQAECAIRMNDAPTTGYEVDVGNKTTFRVVAHSSVYRVLKRPQEFVNKTPETVLIFWGPPAKMQKSLLKIIQRVGASFPNMTAYVVSPRRMRQLDELFRGETGKDRYLGASPGTSSPLVVGTKGRAGSRGCSVGLAAVSGWGDLGVFEGIQGDLGVVLCLHHGPVSPPCHAPGRSRARGSARAGSPW